MATYKDIQTWVIKYHGFVPKTCWIAHCKEIFGLPVRRAHNRSGEIREVPCPPDKQNVIQTTFRHFGMIHS